MLVLSRKEGQSVWIGETQVTVLKDSNGRVRLGIEAPKHIKVLRDEIVRKLGQENAEN